jgi:hypothetical protein
VADRVAAGGPLKPKEAAAVALWRLGGGVGKAPEIAASLSIAQLVLGAEKASRDQAGRAPRWRLLEAR